MKLEELSLTELGASIKEINNRLNEQRAWVGCERGHDLEEYERRMEVWVNNPLQQKLIEVQKRIKELKNSLKHFEISYRSLGNDLKLVLEADSMNDVMILFATRYPIQRNRPRILNNRNNQ